MAKLDGAGQIVILNGPPRSGKSSIAVAIQTRNASAAAGLAPLVKPENSFESTDDTSS